MLPLCGMMAGERVEKVPYGDFETWAVRYIKESKIIGGKTKVLYVPSANDTIRENVPYVYGQAGSPWCTSNAYAYVAGIHKGSVSTVPEKRGNGYCCRMECKMESVVAMGIIDLKVVVAGTCFLGSSVEPVGMANAKDPYSVLNVGVPFTKKPDYLMLDYKAIVEQSNVLTYAKATTKTKTLEGHDVAEFYVFLQRRWEDAEGHIHAVRVGTAYERVTKSVPQWQNNHRIPFRYGDITKEKDFKSYEGLTSRFKAINSKGKSVYVQEEGWGDGEPTHMVMFLTSGCYEAFVGHVGNCLWVDNVRLVYND